ncbi:unnamed protein product [Polarella glacialis]|uniref:Uncharacterized protein n=1 Tax=Polarella glacialis TaxID=89957 RepID=A0A813JEL8_POLGL|nr:unnamed protein product [Polarella glacialis]
MGPCTVRSSSFSDGRFARHCNCPSSCLLCDGSSGTLERALFHCPASADARATWGRRVGALAISRIGHETLALVFNPAASSNTAATCAAHVALVSAVCRRGAIAIRELRGTSL